MPFPLLAHQAPVLPLKAWRPAAFNATALVVGSMAPDLQSFLDDPSHSTNFGHTLAGQFVFCLPLTMFVVLFVGNLRLGEVLAARLGRRFAWLVGAATDVSRPGGMRRAVLSALCGSFSHLALDAVTHEGVTEELPHRVFHYAGLKFSFHAIAQVVASAIGVVIALWALRGILRQRVHEPPAPRPGASWVGAFALAGAALGVLRALPAIRHPDWFFEAGRVYVWGYVAFLATAGAGAGVLAASTILAWGDHRLQVRASQPS